MDIHSITFWENSPLLIRQKEPTLGCISKPVNNFFFSYLGSPFFHFFILDKLIAESKRIFINYHSPIAMIDVSIPNNLVEKLMDVNANRWSDSGTFLADFGMWLTEQIAANTIFANDKSLPTIFVRCFDTISDNASFKVIGSSRFVSKLFSLFKFQLTERKFYIYTPILNSHSKTTIKINAPSISLPINEFNFESPSIYFGTQIFDSIGVDELHNICPLVANRHIEIALTDGPSDNHIYAWVKHLGHNETWILHEDQDTLSWELVPEDAWTLISSGARIVLGRAAEVQGAKGNEMIFLSGSIVLTLEYK